MTKLARKPVNETPNELERKPVNEMTNLLNNAKIRSMFENALNENAGAFMSSIIDLYNGDDYLQKCDPKEVMMEALKAASLNLPINKNLGFAYIVPFGRKVGPPKPTFIIGYKGYIQLAQRTGQYKAINAGMIYEGMEIVEDYLSGTFYITGSKKSDTVLGYFSYMKLLNGFEKALYMTVDEMNAYGEKYSPSFKSEYSLWKSDLDSMGQKTVLRRLLGKYGVLSTEIQYALQKDTDFILEAEISDKANRIPLESIEVDTETGEIIDEPEVIKAPF